MKLSACMIVKNEEETIARCLDCVKNFADEIIIVDTGSKDNTVNLVKEYTTKIFHFDWINDFSAARNFSFSKATCEYIMWIDADDIITDENIEKIKQLKTHLNKDVYMLKYAASFDKQGKPSFEYYRERIIKNCKYAKWNGFIHEAISPFGNIEYLDISIYHKKEKPTNPKRNLKIYNYQIKNGRKLNIRETYYYAKELYYNNYIFSAIKILNKFLKFKNRYYPNTIDAIITLARCYKNKNQTTKALTVLTKNLASLYPTSEYLCELGDTYYNNKNFKSAIPYYTAALTITKENNGIFYNNDYYYFIPLLQLSVCYYYTKNYSAAKKYFYLAKSTNSKHDLILQNEKYFKNL